jgi:hypothetical protein
MKFVGLRKDEEEKIIEYELKLYKHDISCLYKDRYGVYVATFSGKLYKVKHTLEELNNELNGSDFSTIS